MSKLSLSRSNLVVANHQIHYAWVIVGVASAMWITSSTIRFAISLLVPQLQDPSGPFGWSYFSIASAFTLQWVLSGVLSPGAGWLGDRYGVRKIMLAGAGLFVAGMLLTGAMSELWEFLLYFGVLMGAAMAIFQVSLITGVSLWFKKNLGLAMGLLQGFQGLGTVLAIVMVYVLFAWLGWRWTFWIPGVAGGFILLLLIGFFHNEPADIGLRQLGADEVEPVRRLQNNELSKIRTETFLKHARKTGAFWNLVGIHFWGCAGHNVILIFLVAMAVDRGVSTAMAAGIYATLNRGKHHHPFRSAGGVGHPREQTGDGGLLYFANGAGADAAGGPGLVGVLRFRRPVRNWPGRRDERVPDYQSPVLRERAFGDNLRLADPGRRGRYGPGAPPGGVSVDLL